MQSHQTTSFWNLAHLWWRDTQSKPLGVFTVIIHPSTPHTQCNSKSAWLSPKDIRNLAYLYLCPPGKALIPSRLGYFHSLLTISASLAFLYPCLATSLIKTLHWCPIFLQGKAQSITEVNRSPKQTGQHTLFYLNSLYGPHPLSSSHASLLGCS